MIEYNTQLEKLILPEYGRNVQKMVDYCLTIPDREKRTQCAYTIIRVMGNLFPQLKNEIDFRHKLWDHLAIMADFKLDIDYPYEVITEEELTTRPDPLGYHLESIKYRHYGKIIEKMIERAATYPEGEEKDVLISLLAHHMKKLMFAISKEGVEDEKILKDLFRYSHGKINLDPSTYKLRVFKEAPAPQQPQKKNKKKK